MHRGVGRISFPSSKPLMIGFRRPRSSMALRYFDAASGEMLAAFLRASTGPRSEKIDWIEAVQMSSGRPVRFPADLCLRRTARAQRVGPAVQPELRLRRRYHFRSGCAAWDAGAGRTGCCQPVVARRCSRSSVALEGSAVATAAALVAHARGATNTRRTWLLDITTDLDVPSIVAISSRVDDSGFACGLAAPSDPAERGALGTAGDVPDGTGL